MVSLTSIPGKILEQIIKQSLCKHLENNAVITRSQNRCVKNESCQTSLITLFFYKGTSVVDGGNAIDIIYIQYSKAFDKVSHYILTCKLTRCGLDRTVIRWTHSCLQSCTQRVVINVYFSCKSLLIIKDKYFPS